MSFKMKSVFLIFCLVISSVSFVLLADEYNSENDILEKERGLVIIKVIPDSPAEKAGIKRGDLLLAIDGKDVFTFNEMYNLLSKKKSGESVELEIRHGDNNLQKTIVLEDNVKKKPVGLVFAPQYDHNHGRHYGLQKKFQNLYKFYQENEGEANGVIVTKVIKNSPAEKAGIQSGDLILAIDDDKINPDKRLKDIVAGYEPNDEVSIQIYSKNGAKDVLVVLTEKDEKPFLGVYYYELPDANKLKEKLENSLNKESQYNYNRKRNFNNPSGDKDTI